MNRFEDRMVSILQELRENHGAISLRAEFESEGSRIEELLRLKEIAGLAGVDLTLIIGGCESIRDLIESKAVGVNTLAAPMIESAYALRKYLQAVKKVFLPEELDEVEIYANIESAVGLKKLDRIIDNAGSFAPNLRGIVIERVDLCHSLGMGSDDINHPTINTMVEEAARRITGENLKLTIGGGVSPDSLPFFRSLMPGLLDRFETRKVVFNAEVALAGDPARAITGALGFELFYLKNKLTFSKNIKENDLGRLNLLEQICWNTLSGPLPAGGVR